MLSVGLDLVLTTVCCQHREFVYLLSKHGSVLFQNDSVVAGGGAIEMEISKHLRDHSRTIKGKQQMLIAAYAKVQFFSSQIVSRLPLNSAC